MSDQGWATPGGEEQGGARPDDASGTQDGPPPPPPPGGAPLPPGRSSLPPPQWPAPPPPGTGTPPPPGSASAGPRAGLVPLYPMGVGDVLDTAFRLLRATAAPSSLLVVVLLGPVAILTSLAFVSPTDMFNETVSETPDAEILVLTLLGAALALLVRPLAMTALVWLGARTDQGAAPDWQAALKGGWRRYGHALGAFAILGGAVLVAGVVGVFVVGVAAGVTGGIGGVLLGIPLFLVLLVGMVLALVVGHLVIPVIVVEELGPVQGLRRTWVLVRRRFWPVIGYSILAGIVFELLGGAVSFIVTIPALFGLPGSFLFVALSSVLDSLITVPLASFAALAIYVDLRIRTEGYDVAVLAAELRR